MMPYVDDVNDVTVAEEDENNEVGDAVNERDDAVEDNDAAEDDDVQLFG